MHWSLKQSISQSHKGSVIKFVLTVKFNINHLTLRLGDTEGQTFEWGPQFPCPPRTAADTGVLVLDPSLLQS